MQQRDVQAQREQVHVVARVADQRHALPVARHVAAVRAEQELRRVGDVEQERRADRAVRVEHLQVELGCTGVAQRQRVDPAGRDRRAVGGDVVRDQLAEERPAGGLGGVVAVARPAQDRGGVADPAGLAGVHQQPGVGAQRVEAREHAPVAGRPGGPVHRAGRAEAVVAGGGVAAVRVWPEGGHGRSLCRGGGRSGPVRQMLAGAAGAFETCTVEADRGLSQSQDRPAGEVIRTPDQRLRVFVSSTLGELAEERAAVARAITALRLTPVLFELGARPHPPRELYRAYLAQSDIFIGMYWQRYGWVGPGMDISGLEDEFRLSGSLPRLLYVKAPAPDREPGLTAMIKELEAQGTSSYLKFSNSRELARLVREDLATLLSERFAARASHSGAPAPATGQEAARRPRSL